MSVRIMFIVFALFFWHAPVQAQGFAGMGSGSDGYLLPVPDKRFDFPADHGAHPGFRIEWWYLTANLRDEAGTEYGIQWTLFRSALSPQDGDGWQTPVLWMGHAAITTPDAHYVGERFARGGIGQAGVTATPFEAWIDDWAMTGIEDGRLIAKGGDFAYDLAFTAQGPFVPQGQNGYSVKSEAGQASHYYSQPFYQLSGTLDLPTGPVEVTGEGWLDREWSSQPLTEEQTGWDWLSLHFDDGTKLMAYGLRSTESSYIVGTWITPEGTPAPLENGQILLDPIATSDVEGRKVPTTWRVQLPEKALDITATALNPQSWMGTTISYWEGPVRVTGTHPGRGYLEMTGYD